MPPRGQGRDRTGDFPLFRRSSGLHGCISAGHAGAVSDNRAFWTTCCAGLAAHWPHRHRDLRRIGSSEAARGGWLGELDFRPDIAMIADNLRCWTRTSTSATGSPRASCRWTSGCAATQARTDRRGLGDRRPRLQVQGGLLRNLVNDLGGSFGQTRASSEASPDAGSRAARRPACHGHARDRTRARHPNGKAHLGNCSRAWSRWRPNSMTPSCRLSAVAACRLGRPAAPRPRR